jgi:protein FrlC
MKLGTATSVLFQFLIQDAVDIVARAGYDGIDVWGGRPHVYRQDLSGKELRALRQRIEDRSLEVASFMPAFYRYPHSLSSPNPRIRGDSIEYVCECVDSAVVLGAPIVLLVPDHSLVGTQKADALRYFSESIDIVARYAEQYNHLKLGIEILYYDETDLINSADDALNLINQLGHANLGVVLDTGTLNLSKESLSDIFDKLNGLVLQIHANDNHGRRKQENLIPGEGTYDFSKLMRFLAQRQFSGFVSAELSREYAGDPEPSLRMTAERLRKWMQTAEKVWTRPN